MWWLRYILREPLAIHKFPWLAYTELDFTVCAYRKNAHLARKSNAVQPLKTAGVSLGSLSKRVDQLGVPDFRRALP